METMETFAVMRMTADGPVLFATRRWQDEFTRARALIVCKMARWRWPAEDWRIMPYHAARVMRAGDTVPESIH